MLRGMGLSHSSKNGARRGTSRHIRKISTIGGNSAEFENHEQRRTKREVEKGTEMTARTLGLGGRARKVLKRPGAFALAVIKHFRANQGLLLAGAVAYYTLLSLIPVLILILMALSHIFEEDRILLMLRGSISNLSFRVSRTPWSRNCGISSRIGNWWAAFSLVTMLFFSALAFTVLENAMSVIFFHRVAIRRRHFLVSAVMPYLFIIFLGIGVLIVTLVSGVLHSMGTRNITIFGQAHSLANSPRCFSTLWA